MLMAPKEYHGMSMSISDIGTTIMSAKEGKTPGILLIILLLCMVAGFIGLIATAASSKKKFGVDHTNDENK